jgi:hypothetical protein
MSEHLRKDGGGAIGHDRRSASDDGIQSLDDLTVLNRNGLRTGRGNFWTRERVTALRSHHDIPVYCAERRTREGWLNLTEAAQLAVVPVSAWRLPLASM